MLRRVIHNSVWALALAGFTACIGSCQDEDIVKRSGVEEGIPVTLQLNAHPSIPGEVMVQTRAVTDPEYRVNDLVVLVFNTNTGELKDKQLFTTDDGLRDGQNETADPTLQGTVSINTTSGAVTVYAIANTILRPSEYVSEGETATATGSRLHQNVMAVNSLSDLERVTAKLGATDANAIDRIGATHHILSGALEGTLASDGTFTAGTTSTNTPEIPLYRTDSEICMNISAGTGTDSKCTGFTLLSYRVMRVPNQTSLVPLYNSDGTTRRNYDTGSDQAANYFNVASVQASENSISFYVPENIKQAKDNSLTTYHQRDLRAKNDDKTNQVDENQNAVFQYAPDNGTYVVLHGLYEGTGSTTQQIVGEDGNLDTDGGEIGMRATVDYIIHLGDFGTSLSDFSNCRNTRYTYNVTVKGVDEIVVEVEVEGTENQPGAEGEVFFQDGTYFDIDCHNEALVLTFTKQEIDNGRYTADQNDFTYRINSPFGSGDDTWLKFLPNDKSSGTYSKTLQAYPGDNDEDLWTLQQLVDNLKAIKDGTASGLADDNGDLVVTCFVNEYVYTGETATQLGIDDWGDYVNQTNREAYIFGDIRNSADQASSTIHTKYIISQRAIQTMDAYYAGIGLGIETLNETGNLPMGNPSGKPTDSETGRANTLAMLFAQAPGHWGYTLADSESGYTMVEAGEAGNGADIVAPAGTTYRYAVPTDYAYAAYACLMRNRDEDGSGTIENDEIHWYLPSLDQYAAIYAGADALAMEARLYSNYVFHTLTHYLTSTWGTRDGDQTPWIIWSEEGHSTQLMPTNTSGNPDMGDSGDWLTERKRPYRCIRNLGDESDVEGTNRTPFYGTFVNTDGNSVIAFNHLNDGVFRTRMVGGELEPHNELSTANKLYGAFAVAKDYVKGEEDPGGGEEPDPGTDPDPDPEPEPGDEPLLENPTWPFYTWSQTTLENLAADTDKWEDAGDYYNLVDGEKGKEYVFVTDNGPITELVGLAFARNDDGGEIKDRIRIMKNGSLMFNNDDTRLIVLACTADDVISIEFASVDGGSNAVSWNVDNATFTSGSETTVERAVATYTVTADGNVTFHNDGKIYIYAIDRAAAGEAQANAAPAYRKAPIHRAPTVKNGYQIWTASEVRELPSICHTYSEKADGSDAGTWRLPNQRELMMMLTAGIIGGPDDTAAAAAVEVHCQTTYSFHNDGSKKQYYSMQYDESGSIMRVGDDDVKGLVRCVKDVDPQTGN